MSTASLLKWRHFLPKIILLNVRWYCRYSLSYRDLEEMMQERGMGVYHSTINRWVLRYAPGLDQTDSTTPETDERLVARGRNLYQS
jgi:transposase-like protein